MAGKLGKKKVFQTLGCSSHGEDNSRDKSEEHEGSKGKRAGGGEEEQGQLTETKYSLDLSLREVIEKTAVSGNSENIDV